MTLSELIAGLQHKLEVFGDIKEIRTRFDSGFGSVQITTSGCLDADEGVLWLGSSDDLAPDEPCQGCGREDCDA